MSLDSPQSNKMMASAPAKKEYHFAATAEHYAEVVQAATIKEAESIYHKMKRPVFKEEPDQPPKELSTPEPENTEEANG